MATPDVPGYNIANQDTLAMGCWAEHKDGSLIYVQSVENGEVVFFVFDAARTPMTEYRSIMREEIFKKAFSHASGESIQGEYWTWHDKTPFDWRRIINAGTMMADNSVALVVAKELHMQISEMSAELQRGGKAGDKIISKIQKALDRLKP